MKTFYNWLQQWLRDYNTLKNHWVVHFKGVNELHLNKTVIMGSLLLLGASTTGSCCYISSWPLLCVFLLLLLVWAICTSRPHDYKDGSSFSTQTYEVHSMNPEASLTKPTYPLLGLQPILILPSVKMKWVILLMDLRRVSKEFCFWHRQDLLVF